MAFELGPFFFAILFTLLIVGMAHRCYRNIRKEPKASEKEKKCYMMYFVSSFVAGLLLVFISVAWWMYAHIAKHTLEGRIIGLEQNQILQAYTDNVYLRTAERPVAGGWKTVEIEFAIVRDSPFNQGQKFTFFLYPQIGYIGDKKPEPITLTIDYAGKDYERYKLVKNGATFLLERDH